MSRSFRIAFFPILIVLFGLAPHPLSLAAQNTRSEAKDKNIGNNEKGNAEEETAKIHAPVELDGERWYMPLMGPPMGRLPGVTADGVKLTAVFCPGYRTKETVPIVLLHGKHGSREDFRPLIDRLAEEGHAVLAVDLRGHGKSTKHYTFETVTPPAQQQQASTHQHRGGGAPRSTEMKNIRTRRDFMPVPTQAAPSPKLEEMKADDFQPKDYFDMAKYDLPMLRQFLKVQNDLGHLNLNRLILLGTDTGAALAAYWAIQDWKDRHADRDTKTLIMIAPSGIVPQQKIEAMFEDTAKPFKEQVRTFIVIPSTEGGIATTAVNIKQTILTEKDLETDPPGFESKVPIISLDSDKPANELFLSDETGLVNMIDSFIKDRQSRFKEKEFRWTKSK